MPGAPSSPGRHEEHDMPNEYAIRRLSSGLALFALALALGGCAKQFTRERFDMIKPGVDTKLDVERMIGRPEFDVEDQWYYEDKDDHYAALIFFDEQGNVTGKQWMDAGTGEWSGENPLADRPPADEPRERHKKTTIIEDD
jgi:hypothetical protein